MSFNTQFYIQSPIDTNRRDSFGARQIQWSNIEKWGQMIPLTARDYEFANAYNAVISGVKLRTWRDELTILINRDSNVLIGGKPYNVVFTRLVPNEGTMGVFDGGELMDIYLEGGE